MAKRLDEGISMSLQASPDLSRETEPDVLYKLEDTPPMYLAIILAFQHYLTMFCGAIAVPFLISSELCMENDNPHRGEIISATLFASGIATIMQASFGCRLPIIQGPSLSFLIPVLTILALPKWKCPSRETYLNMTDSEKDEVWMSRMREIQGAIIAGSCVEVLVGLTGLIGLLMKWITPLSIVPTITLIGLSLFKESAKQASGNWGISALTIILLIIISQYMAEIKMPKCSYSKNNSCHVSWFPFFKLFPIVLAVILTWGLCAILTAADVLPINNDARTDKMLSGLRKSPWFLAPYPGKFGVPTFNIGPALGIIAGVVASVVESVGDYYACAKLSGAPPPPVHAINRGIMMEGVGCVVAGIMGTGSGLTSFSQNIGAIAITKVGSRRVILLAGVMVIAIGMVGKFGMLLVAMPTPIMGGILCVMFSIITGVGLSSLQYINLNSSRNLFIIGFSVFMGLCIPAYLHDQPNALQTGNALVDQIIDILLKTSMFVGGFLGCLLDNTIPASLEDRGILTWRRQTMSESIGTEFCGKCYDLPYGMEFIRRFSWMKYFPVSPTYEGKIPKLFFFCKSSSEN